MNARCAAEGRQQTEPQVQHQAAGQPQPAAGPGSAGRDRSLAAEHDHDPSHNTHAQTEGEDTFFDAEEGETGFMLYSALSCHAYLRGAVFAPFCKRLLEHWFTSRRLTNQVLEALTSSLG